MPETYDVQKRSFIKKPETKFCITCGQPLPSDVKPMTNEMNNYLNPISNRVVCMNSSEDIVEVQGVKLYKVTGNKEGKPISKHIPVEPQAEIGSPKTESKSMKLVDGKLVPAN